MQILIAEDEFESRIMMQEIMASYGDVFTVVSFFTGSFWRDMKCLTSISEMSTPLIVATIESGVC